MKLANIFVFFVFFPADAFSFVVFKLHRYRNHRKSLTVAEKTFQANTKKENFGEPAFA